jgi:ribosomal protein L11 methylase PrmA
VFSSGGIVHRQVNAGFERHYRRLIDSGLYEELVSDRLLVPHVEVDLRLRGAPVAAAVLRPEQIPFISYPYEWCFGQLKAAALLTLELQRRALKRDLVLRDATAYNVQFLGSHPVFIDTLSFGSYTEGSPWLPYRQFCEHFLAPLALMALVDPSLGQLSRAHLDGIPLDVTSRLLPFRSRLRPGLLTHIHLHSRSLVSGPRQHTAAATPLQRSGMSRTGMLGLIDSLTRTVTGLSWDPPETLWSTYADHTNYSATAQEHKHQLIADWLREIHARTSPKMIWDVGSNTGVYSRLAATATPARIVALDLDPAAVEQLYRSCSQRDDRRILPLVQDLRNPSAAAGWHHAERRSLQERGPADVALALALVHHLALGGNVPLPDIAAFFRKVCATLIIEFVPKEDSQIQRMLALREDVFAGYSREAFEEAFRTCFEIEQSAAIADTHRTLYLMTARR